MKILVIMLLTFSFNVLANEQLENAIFQQDLEQFESVIQNDLSADINYKNSWGNSLLTTAMQICTPQNSETNMKIISRLIDLGININAQDSQGNSPLMLALSFGKFDIAQLFMNSGGDINLQNTSQNTALIFAIQNGASDIALAFINSNIDVNVHSKNGTSPLMLSVFQRDLELFKSLIQHGANINNFYEALSWPSNTKEIRYIIHYAVYAPIDFLQTLLASGVDLDVKNEAGDTAFTDIFDPGQLIENKLTVATTLLDFKTNINHRNNLGDTALHRVIENKTLDQLKLAQFLIKQGINTKLKNKKGFDVLALAKKYKNHKMIKLIKKNQKNRRGLFHFFH